MTRLDEIKDKLKNKWLTHGWVMDSHDFSKIKTEDVRDIDHEMKWLIARVERLETALRFYADGINTYSWDSKLEDDGGKRNGGPGLRAREALEER